MMWFQIINHAKCFKACKRTCGIKMKSFATCKSLISTQPTTEHSLFCLAFHVVLSRLGDLFVVVVVGGGNGGAANLEMRKRLWCFAFKWENYRRRVKSYLHLPWHLADRRDLVEIKVEINSILYSARGRKVTSNENLWKQLKYKKLKFVWKGVCRKYLSWTPFIFTTHWNIFSAKDFYRKDIFWKVLEFNKILDN